MSEPEKRIVLEEIEFGQLFRFPKILRAVTMALQPPKLILGLVLVAALMSLGRVWDRLSTPFISPNGLVMGAMTAQDEQIAKDIMHAAIEKYLPQERRPDAVTDADSMNARGVIRRLEGAHRERRAAIQDEQARAGADAEFQQTILNIDDQRPRGIFEATTDQVTTGFNTVINGLVTLRLGEVYAGAGELFVTTPTALWKHDAFFTSVYGLVFLVVMALGGGAIARMTAVEIATGEKIRLQDGAEFAARASRRLIFSLILPLVIAAVICTALILGGALLMLPGISMIGGLLYGLALLLGFAVVFLLVGYGIGFGLLVPAVACENCDAPDAQQRAYAYVLSRPLHLVGYTVVAAVGLALGYTLICAIAAAVLNVTGGLVGAWTGNPALGASQGFTPFDLSPNPDSIPFRWDSRLSGWFVSFWQTLVVGLVTGYVFCYYFTATTIVYLLMRRASDGQELTEIWQPGEVPGTTMAEPESASEER